MELFSLGAPQDGIISPTAVDRKSEVCPVCGRKSFAYAHAKQERRSAFIAAMEDELSRAYAKHGEGQWGRHEMYGILKEEVDELWDDIKRDAPLEDVVVELVQVAAMCLRYYEQGDRYQGFLPAFKS